jgi:hypothetical protein
MAQNEADLGELLERISRAVKRAIGDGPFDLDVAVTIARVETDAIRRETGVNFKVEQVGDGYNLVVPMNIALR